MKNSAIDTLSILFYFFKTQILTQDFTKEIETYFKTQVKKQTFIMPFVYMLTHTIQKHISLHNPDAERRGIF